MNFVFTIPYKIELNAIKQKEQLQIDSRNGSLNWEPAMGKHQASQEQPGERGGERRAPCAYSHMLLAEQKI